MPAGSSTKRPQEHVWVRAELSPGAFAPKFCAPEVCRKGSDVWPGLEAEGIARAFRPVGSAAVVRPPLGRAPCSLLTPQLGTGPGTSPAQAHRGAGRQERDGTGREPRCRVCGGSGHAQRPLRAVRAAPGGEHLAVRGAEAAACGSNRERAAPARHLRARGRKGAGHWKRGTGRRLPAPGCRAGARATALQGFP